MSIRLVWIQDAWADYVHWQQADKAMLRRINDLVRDALRHPFEGIGKPERLRGDLSGYWSRRIDREHRLVYKVIDTDDGMDLIIIQCRYHY